MGSDATQGPENWKDSKEIWKKTLKITCHENHTDKIHKEVHKPFDPVVRLLPMAPLGWVCFVEGLLWDRCWGTTVTAHPSEVGSLNGQREVETQNQSVGTCWLEMAHLLEDSQGRVQEP